MARIWRSSRSPWWLYICLVKVDNKYLAYWSSAVSICNWSLFLRLLECVYSRPDVLPHTILSHYKRWSVNSFVEMHVIILFLSGHTKYDTFVVNKLICENSHTYFVLIVIPSYEIWWMCDQQFICGNAPNCFVLIAIPSYEIRYIFDQYFICKNARNYAKYADDVT